MLRSETLFGKRETPTPNSPLNSNLTSNSPSSFAKPVNPVAPGNVAVSSQHSNSSSTSEGGSKLIVGPKIKLKGAEITDCDTLVVEGRVEATMSSRVIHIAEKGAFKGSVEVDLAEIHGEFDGDLTVREKLVVYATGRVSGKIRYGKVVIEEGGQLIGEMQVGTAAKVTAPPVATVSANV